MVFWVAVIVNFVVDGFGKIRNIWRMTVLKVDVIMMLVGSG